MKIWAVEYADVDSPRAIFVHLASTYEKAIEFVLTNKDYKSSKSEEIKDDFWLIYEELVDGTYEECLEGEVFHVNLNGERIHEGDGDDGNSSD